MSDYFSKFPVIAYDQAQVRDITKRVNFIQTNLSNPYIFLPYTVKDGEKPEDIAFHYYGTVDATWLILMANSIIDPYAGWPMSDEVLSEYIIDKYRTLSGNLEGYEVLAWTQDETRFDNIQSFYKVTEIGNVIYNSSTTFDEILASSEMIIDDDLPVSGIEILPGFIPYRYYQYEMDQNNNKREILVVESSFYPRVEKEFKVLMKK